MLHGFHGIPWLCHVYVISSSAFPWLSKRKKLSRRLHGLYTVPTPRSWPQRATGAGWIPWISCRCSEDFCWRKHRKTWQCVKTLYPCSSHQNSWEMDVHPPKNVSIGIDPYPHRKTRNLPKYGSCRCSNLGKNKWWSEEIRIVMPRTACISSHQCVRRNATKGNIVHWHFMPF